MKIYFSIVIFSLLLGLLTYLHYDNKQLKFAIDKLQIENQKIIRTENNLRNYELLKEKLTFCPMNENSFILQSLEFNWINVEFSDLLNRLNSFYRYDRVSLITQFTIVEDSGQKNINKKLFRVNGVLLAPCL